MLRKKYYSKKDQPTDTIDITITGTILTEPEIIEYASGKIKQVFDIKTTLENTCTCICWQKYNIKKGDTITSQGRLNTITKHIVLWGLQIVKRCEN